MPAKQTKYKDLLDYTISYKAVWTIIGIVFAFLVAGGIAWTRMKPPGEDEKARQEVKSAERLVQRADGCAQQALKADDERLLSEGKAAFDAASAALTRRDFGSALGTARESQDKLKLFVESVCAARDAVAEFIKIQGDVKVKKVQSPRWVPARKGQLAVGDRIWAIDGAASIAYKASGERQDISPGTIIEIKDVIQRADGMSGTDTSLEVGELHMNTAANSPSVIHAPNLTVEPRGAPVEVESPKGSNFTRVTARRDGAVVTQGTTSRTLTRNTRVEGTAAALGEIEKSLPPPELKEPIDGRIFSMSKPEDIVFTWLPMDDVQSYLFDIARNDVFAPVLNAGENERTAQPTVALTMPTPNTYWWRVAGVDSKGIRGDWSEVRRFSVRGNVPAGQGPPPPTLDLARPVEFGDRVIIKGKTQQYVTLEVNLNGRKYEDLTPDENGEFQALVTLSQEGKNTIEVVAHDTYGQETKKQVTAHFTL